MHTCPAASKRPEVALRRRRRRRNLIVAVVAAIVSSFLTIVAVPAVAAAELVGIQVRLADDNSAIVTWETDVATSASLVYGTTSRYGQAW